MKKVIGFIACAAAALLACNGLIGVRSIYLGDDGGETDDPDAEATADATAAGDGGTRRNTDASDASESQDGAVNADGAHNPDAAEPGDAASLCAPDASFTADPKNCGRCGRDCVVGGCAAGQCTPFAVVSTGSPRYIALDSQTLYYTDSQYEALRKVPKGGGSPTTIAATPGTGTDGLVIDATKAYFTFDNLPDSGPGGVATALLSATATTGTVMVPNQMYPRSLIIDGTNLYWVQALNTKALVMEGPIGGTTKQLAMGDLNADVTLYVSGGLLYQANDTGGGTLKRCTPPACTDQVTLANDTDGIDAVTVAAGNLIWATGVIPGTLWQAQPDGGNPQKITVGPPIPHTLLTDASYAYWLTAGEKNQQTDDYDNGSVMRCPIVAGSVDCGNGPETLATGQYYVHGLVMDETFVYWVGDKVYRLPK